MWSLNTRGGFVLHKIKVRILWIYVFSRKIRAILTMNSEAMIPSTMAQKKEAMTPILMKTIAATSLKKAGGKRNKQYEKLFKRKYPVSISNLLCCVLCPDCQNLWFSSIICKGRVVHSSILRMILELKWTNNKKWLCLNKYLTSVYNFEVSFSWVCIYFQFSYHSVPGISL